MKMNNIAVTGARGKIGSRLVSLGCIPIMDDITDEKAMLAQIQSIKPDVIIHAACMSGVDACELDYKKAILVNVRGTAIVFKAAADVVGEGRCVLLSSEQVFDGRKGGYSETDTPNPINNYGRTKHGAEALAQVYGNKIIRLSRGVSIYEKDIAKYLEALKSGRDIFVPEFIFRNYSHLDFLAESIFAYAQGFDEMPNLLHLGGSANVSFFWFMTALAQKLGLDYWAVKSRQEKEDGHAKRPEKCGFDLSLMHYLGIPIFTPYQTVDRMRMEWTDLQRQS